MFIYTIECGSLTSSTPLPSLPLHSPPIKPLQVLFYSSSLLLYTAPSLFLVRPLFATMSERTPPPWMARSKSKSRKKSPKSRSRSKEGHDKKREERSKPRKEKLVRACARARTNQLAYLQKYKRIYTRERVPGGEPQPANIFDCTCLKTRQHTTVLVADWMTELAGHRTN